MARHDELGETLLVEAFYCPSLSEWATHYSTSGKADSRSSVLPQLESACRCHAERCFAIHCPMALCKGNIQKGTTRAGLIALGFRPPSAMESVSRTAGRLSCWSLVSWSLVTAQRRQPATEASASPDAGASFYRANTAGRYQQFHRSELIHRLIVFSCCKAPPFATQMLTVAAEARQTAAIT